jgi:hypothetical protein
VTATAQLHDGHCPPQSTPVSMPFFTPSAQVGAAHVEATQTPLPQSMDSAHGSPSSQLPGGQTCPPQSMATSEPFCTPSWQLGG